MLTGAKLQRWKGADVQTMCRCAPVQRCICDCTGTEVHSRCTGGGEVQRCRSIEEVQVQLAQRRRGQVQVLVVVQRCRAVEVLRC